MSDYRLYQVGLTLVEGIGAVRFQALMECFGSAEGAWNGSPADLAVADLGAKVIDRFVDVCAKLDLVRYSDQIQQQNIRILPWDDYHLHLKEIALHADDICTQSDLPIEKDSAALTTIELKDVVRQVRGRHYVTVREESGDYTT